MPILKAAQRIRMTVAEWVRQALRAARRREPEGKRARKLAAIREAGCHRFPAPPIEQMLDEIEGGHLGDTPKSSS